MTEWQPIETAPKDGTTVDLWHSEFGRHPGYYWGLPHHECGEAGRYCDSEWHGSSEGWVDSTFNEFSFEPEGFTHWMPIPMPPKTDGSGMSDVNDELLSALKSILRFGWPANIETNPEARMLGGKKPSTADVWTFPKHMLPQIEAAIAKAEAYT